MKRGQSRFWKSTSQKYFGRQKEADQYFLAFAVAVASIQRVILIRFVVLFVLNTTSQALDNGSDVKFKKEILPEKVKHGTLNYG